MRVWFSVRAGNHQWLPNCSGRCFWVGWGRVRWQVVWMATCLQKNLFLTGMDYIAIVRIFGLIGTWVLILPHLWWGRVYLLLGIHHTLVWNRVLQNKWRWWLQIMLWGKRRWRVLGVHGFFHLFETKNLGEMVSIMSMLTVSTESHTLNAKV